MMDGDISGTLLYSAPNICVFELKNFSIDLIHNLYSVLLSASSQPIVQCPREELGVWEDVVAKQGRMR